MKSRNLINPEHSCKGKTRFSTIGKARKSIKITQVMHNGRRPRAYVCPKCKGFHLASTE